MLGSSNVSSTSSPCQSSPSIALPLPLRDDIAFISEKPPRKSEWKKPYEILLVGKKTEHKAKQPRRRVIIAVPDLHSRKPCLKHLVEKLLLWPGCSGLEVFARNLVSGWMSWGNEVLKYQWTGMWDRARLDSRQ